MLSRQCPGRSELRAEAVLRRDGAGEIHKPLLQAPLAHRRSEFKVQTLRRLPQGWRRRPLRLGRLGHARDVERGLRAVRLAALVRLSRGEVPEFHDTSN